MYEVKKDYFVKSLAFEKAVLEVLKRDNPELLENYYEEEQINGIKRRYQYDAVISKMLNLRVFGQESIYANRIAIEIKYSFPSFERIRYFISCAENKFDTIVFIIAAKNRNGIYKVSDNTKCKIKFIFLEDLINCNEIRKLIENFDNYIVEENNIIIPDNYGILKKTKENIAFALGAGCSRESHISDWNTLCEALGYEMMYKIIDTKSSEYKNKIIADELNKRVFSCFDKNSALDAIYNSFISGNIRGQRDYWMSIKNVLYMNYESPIDAKQPLMNSIVKCIKRRNIEAVINYNFDSVLEQNFTFEYKSTPREIQSCITHVNNCKIYHVHGYIPFDYDGKVDINIFIFTDKEYYENMMNSNSFCNVEQTNILFQKNVIFVGVSFTDSNMKEILRKRMSFEHSNEIFAFLKLPNFDYDGINKKLIENQYKIIQQRYFDSLGVKILWVNDFSEIPARIDNL